MTFHRAATLLLTATALAVPSACGGGEGAPTSDMNGPNSANGMSDMSDTSGGGPREDPFLDPRITANENVHSSYRNFAEHARTVTGGQAPTLSSSGHDARVRQIAADGDTLAMHVSWREAGSSSSQIDPECSGTTCTLGDPANTITAGNLVPAQVDIIFFPVMRRNGIEVHDSQLRGVDHFGPWQGNTYAAVLNHVVAATGHRAWPAGHSASIRMVWGTATGSNPVAGSASWSGVMVGTALRPDTGRPANLVQGDVAIMAHFGSETTLDVLFSDVKGLHYEADYTIDPWMDLEVSGGSFADGNYSVAQGDRYMEGQFFGPGAEEVGGFFHDRHASDPETDISGAFGAARSGQ